ncbi:radical SAM protein [Paraburkholderia sp. RP-4-7]|uniref:Radical SAM protein n=1 Tax=Paraburkholderia polaris TaxID=2728848 RepID=A0A848ID36_9BURK|nr:radical SAM protein [Paraburkholderia polaris]
MNLVDILSARTVPCRGAYLAITRRCPLSCAHCLSESSNESEEHSAQMFKTFVETMTPECRPDFILLTGGEPLLRPKLVSQLSHHARSAGCTVCVATGMFFARSPSVPRLIQTALTEVDIVTASIDEFHEREVSRASVFRAVHWLLNQGKFVHFQTVTDDPASIYLRELLTDVKAHFGGEVPVFVGKLSPVGRAAAWMRPTSKSCPSDSGGCGMASWPVVTYSGAIAACCNQDVVNGPIPAHLQVGHAAYNSWSDVCAAFSSSATIRAIRVYGPHTLAFAAPLSGETTYCETCQGLSSDPTLTGRARNLMGKPFSAALELMVDSNRIDPGNFTLAGYEDWLGSTYERFRRGTA